MPPCPGLTQGLEEALTRAKADKGAEADKFAEERRELEARLREAESQVEWARGEQNEEATRAAKELRDVGQRLREAEQQMTKLKVSQTPEGTDCSPCCLRCCCPDGSSCCVSAVTNQNTKREEAQAPDEGEGGACGPAQEPRGRPAAPRGGAQAAGGGEGPCGQGGGAGPQRRGRPRHCREARSELRGPGHAGQELHRTTSSPSSAACRWTP